MTPSRQIQNAHAGRHAKLSRQRKNADPEMTPRTSTPTGMSFNPVTLSVNAQPPLTNPTNHATPTSPVLSGSLIDQNSLPAPRVVPSSAGLSVRSHPHDSTTASITTPSVSPSQAIITAHANLADVSRRHSAFTVIPNQMLPLVALLRNQAATYVDEAQSIISNGTSSDATLNDAALLFTQATALLEQVVEIIAGPPTLSIAASTSTSSLGAPAHQTGIMSPSDDGTPSITNRSETGDDDDDEESVMPVRGTRIDRKDVKLITTKAGVHYFVRIYNGKLRVGRVLNQ